MKQRTGKAFGALSYSLLFLVKQHMNTFFFFCNKKTSDTGAKLKTALQQHSPWAIQRITVRILVCIPLDFFSKPVCVCACAPLSVGVSMVISSSVRFTLQVWLYTLLFPPGNILFHAAASTSACLVNCGIVFYLFIIIFSK